MRGVMLEDLLKRNKAWANRLKQTNANFFETLANQQLPKYLWIGCADSRVPATEVVDLMPGEMFVHRNVANMVVSTDMNLLSVLQYAVDVLKVEHIIICGHYGCGGVRAALSHEKFGLIDNWLHSLKGLHHLNHKLFDGLSESEQVDLLCELNVQRQVTNICHNNIIQSAWQRGQKLAIHGWIYGLHDGIIKDLDITHHGQHQLYEEFIYEHTELP